MPDDQEVYVLCHWNDSDGLEIIDVYSTVELAMARELPSPEAVWREGSWAGVWEAGEDEWNHGWTIARQRLITP